MPGNYAEDIERLKRINARLSHDEIGILLTAEELYRMPPDDYDTFWSIYPHFDPKVITSKPSGITFITLTDAHKSSSVMRGKLNSYLNIHFNALNQYRSYNDNMRRFRIYSQSASAILDDIIKIAAYPPSLSAVFTELDQVRKCTDPFELVQLYASADHMRTRYEILRKIGLIVLLARINQGVGVGERDHRLGEMWDAICCRLGCKQGKKKMFYYRLVDNQILMVKKDSDVETFTCNPFVTRKGNLILHMERRNKLERDGELYYTAFVEKMIRKNLEFPSMVHDVNGIKFIVSSEDEIADLIHELESFLGGSSTRKQEKDTYHKFGRRLLNKHSSKEYYVWKAVYDITLTHPAIPFLNLAIRHCSDVGERLELLKLREKYSRVPRDYLIEVQIQDLHSHLLSITPGSPTEHTILKRNQVRSNSFHKLFPKEVYGPEVQTFMESLLSGTR